jgi:adenosylcobinamide kinase / adenosylcobinamide-phosphate guanylyltransferase
MTALVTGAAASGKSQFAEKLAVAASSGNLAYFATMDICDKECEARVKKHRLMRAGKGFETVECPFGIPEGQNLNLFDTALLECMSNLVANVMFVSRRSPYETVQLILDDVKRLCRSVRNVVIVTNEVFSGVDDYDESTRGYIQALGEINREIAANADAVIESVCGIPVYHKGKEAIRRYEGIF